jgi:hypothetical protein
MALDESIIQSVANANFKTMAELPIQNAISHQQAMQMIREKSVAKSLEQMDTVQVPEGLGLAAAQRGDLPKVITEIIGALASAQQGTKTAQTTPPVTP